MIGIIAAMQAEHSLICQQIVDRQTKTIAGIDFVYGKISGKDVVTAVCGIGKVFAASCAQIMCLEFSPKLIINTGVAGSLDNELSIFDIAVSSSVVQHDMDTSPLGDPVGLVSGINVIKFPADKQTVKKVLSVAQKLNFKAKEGVIASGDQFIADSERKDFIKSQFNAIACEMEGAAIGHVCYINKVPFVVIRSISDNANEDSPLDFPAVMARAANNSATLTLSIINLLE